MTSIVHSHRLPVVSSIRLSRWSSQNWKKSYKRSTTIQATHLKKPGECHGSYRAEQKKDSSYGKLTGRLLWYFCAKKTVFLICFSKIPIISDLYFLGEVSNTYGYVMLYFSGNCSLWNTFYRNAAHSPVCCWAAGLAIGREDPTPVFKWVGVGR